METNVRTPMEIFTLPQHLVVPLFQRPYVWEEEDQWLPLWQDVRRLAELRIRDPFANATHFLGAVVVQAQESQLGHIPASNIIDGQQRLTTLQLLMDAASAALEESGKDALAGQLEGLTHNQDNFVQPGETKLKIRHTNRDQAAYDEVMDAQLPIDHARLKHSGSRIARAHQFFGTAVVDWLGSPTEDLFDQRADALTFVLTRGLQLVAINLAANENSQEIFETLNARGTPLTAADLIKNFVFQTLGSEGVDTARAYAEDWPFETKFWEQDVSVGRHLVSRSSLFLNQWLVSRLGDEIGPQSTFTRFKSFVEHDSRQKMSSLMPLIKEQAEQYERWTLAAADPDRQLDVVEMAVYRMHANGVELLKPILLWLHSPERDLTSDVIHAVTSVLESWVIRRQLLRLTGSDLGRIVADVIRTHRNAPADELVDRITNHLTGLNVASTYWPGDSEVAEALRTEAVYRRFRRGRLRMVLEAIENEWRRTTNQPQIPRRGYPIEHVLPQKWQSHWQVDGLEAEQARGAHVHRLGNLTLLTSALNSKVSNGPWPEKRDAFRHHDTLLLTSRLLAEAHDNDWDEHAIDRRTEVLVSTILKVWPVPSGHTGVILDAQPKPSEWIEIKHLVAAGLLEPGTRLIARAGRWGAAEATVTSAGLIELNGETYDSPSGAGRSVKKGQQTNGWHFWLLPDGRRLADVRAIYTGEEPKATKEVFDWSVLHAVLESIPAGRWASYGTIADVVGTAAQPLGNHIRSCGQCTNAHRVLRSDGSVAENFAWSDPNDSRDPRAMLAEEGIGVIDGRAERSREILADELTADAG